MFSEKNTPFNLSPASGSDVFRRQPSGIDKPPTVAGFICSLGGDTNQEHSPFTRKLRSTFSSPESPLASLSKTTITEIQPSRFLLPPPSPDQI